MQVLKLAENGDSPVALKVFMAKCSVLAHYKALLTEWIEFDYLSAAGDDEGRFGFSKAADFSEQP